MKVRSKAAQRADQGHHAIVETKLKTRSGETRDFLVSGERIEFEGQDCYLFISQDNTERKEAEELLRRSEETKRMILENVVNGIVTITEKGIVESFNPAAEKMFGYSADEVVGRNVNCLMPEPDASKHDDYIQNYLRTGKGKILGVGAREVTARHKNGKSFPM